MDSTAWRNVGKGWHPAPQFPTIRWADSALEEQGWVNMRLPLPTGRPPGRPEAGSPACFLYPGSTSAHLCPSLTPSSSSSPEVFRNVFFSGRATFYMHEHCKHGLERHGQLLACPEYYTVFFPFLGNVFILYSSIYTGTVSQPQNWLCRVETPALPSP